MVSASAPPRTADSSAARRWVGASTPSLRVPAMALQVVCRSSTTQLLIGKSPDYRPQTCGAAPSLGADVGRGGVHERVDLVAGAEASGSRVEQRVPWVDQQRVNPVVNPVQGLDLHLLVASRSLPCAKVWGLPDARSHRTPDDCGELLLACLGRSTTSAKTGRPVVASPAPAPVLEADDVHGVFGAGGDERSRRDWLIIGDEGLS